MIFYIGEVIKQNLFLVVFGATISFTAFGNDNFNIVNDDVIHDIDNSELKMGEKFLSEVNRGQYIFPAEKNHAGNYFRPLQCPEIFCRTPNEREIARNIVQVCQREQQ